MEHRIRDIRTIIRELRGITLGEDYSLARLTTIGVGGRCSAFLVVENEVILAELVRRLNIERIRYYILGNGSKVLFSSNYFKGLIIKLGKGFSNIAYIGNGLLRVGAGTPLSQLGEYCAKTGLGGAEFLWGIPGTVGGACANNAGALGRAISEIVSKVTLIKRDGERVERGKEELNFTERRCQLGEGEVIVSVELTLHPEDKILIKRRMAEATTYRNQTQPKGISFGCCFKNPQGLSAGKLIDEAGLKGFSYGGAYVSPKHANFLLNDGTASFEDFYTLIQIIKLRVERQFGIILEEEVRIVE